MKKLLCTILVGLSLVNFVGCGEAPKVKVNSNSRITVESVVKDAERAYELLSEDFELDESIAKKEKSEGYYNYTEEEWDYIDNESGIDEYTVEMIRKINYGTLEENLQNCSQLDLKAYAKDFELLVQLGENEDKQFIEVEIDTIEQQPTQNEQVQKQPIQENQKAESEELVNLIKDSENYTWTLYDIINGKGNLQDVLNICTEMMDRIDLINMDDCEFEGEYQAVQNLKQAYLDLFNFTSPQVYNGLDMNAEIAVAYNKVNNETTFLMNEINQ
ncbi:TPA: hypothetical protein ACY4R8_000338 [Clostridium perfringens]